MTNAAINLLPEPPPDILHLLANKASSKRFSTATVHAHDHGIVGHGGATAEFTPTVRRSAWPPLELEGIFTIIGIGAAAKRRPRSSAVLQRRSPLFKN